MFKYLILCSLALAGCSDSSEKDRKAASLLNVAKAARQSGNPEAAIKFYNKALDEKNQESPEALLGLAEVYIDRGILSSAEVFISRAEKLSPDLPAAHYLRGKIFLLKGDVKAAEAEFKKDKNHIDSINALGSIYDGFKQHAEAQLLYQKVISKDPNYVDAYNNMGCSLLIEGKYNDAIFYLESACKLPDATPAYRLNLALAYGFIGNMPKAKSILEQDYDGKDLNEKIAYIQDIVNGR